VLTRPQSPSSLPRPASVSRRTHPEPAIRDIRFTRRIARQCSPNGLRVPDWVVCDAIANGSRSPAGLRGARGGKVIRFERTYPAGGPGDALPGAFRGRVEVLCEVTRRCCFALRLLAPAKGGKKTGLIWVF
jgi:hypothetical protein